MLDTVITRRLESEVRALRNEQKVVDALYRFAADVPVMAGRVAIANIIEILAPLATTHTVTNPHVWHDGDPAVLFNSEQATT
jgi:hypothetical protein